MVVVAVVVVVVEMEVEVAVLAVLVLVSLTVWLLLAEAWPLVWLVDAVTTSPVDPLETGIKSCVLETVSMALEVVGLTMMLL
jgi:hypothetical protein